MSRLANDAEVRAILEMALTVAKKYAEEASREAALKRVKEASPGIRALASLMDVVSQVTPRKEK